jgi:hypothetical protein
MGIGVTLMQLDTWMWGTVYIAAVGVVMLVLSMFLINGD